jgi:hypothetical protein
MAPTSEKKPGEAPGPEEAQKQRERAPAAARQPAAGPHAKPELTNPDATPGTGALSEEGDQDGTSSTTG